MSAEEKVMEPWCSQTLFCDQDDFLKNFYC